MDNRPIGMFDSGVGGMTVFSEVKKILKNEKIVYLGDTKRFPYGSKSKQSIIELTRQGVEFLISKNVKAVIIACGTATSQALDAVKDKYDIPISGIIEPTVNYLVTKKDYKRIGVIATKGTIRSNGWEKSIKSKINDIEVINKACPLLAPMAEEGWVDNDVARVTIKEYIKDFKDIDALILGCTHYPLFTQCIREVLGDKVEIINTGTMIANQFNAELSKMNLEADLNNVANDEIYLTDTESNFVNVAQNLVKEEEVLSKIQKAEIEKL